MRILLALALAVVVAGCLSEDDDDDEGATVADARCASGVRWAGGNAESPRMHPGGDCIGCHASDEGPRFSVAGTVHAALDEPDDCFGVPGVTVTVIDADAAQLDLVTNSAGNFYTSARLAMPISIRLELDGRERLMGLMPPVGACASCHTRTGSDGAPGRILAP